MGEILEEPNIVAGESRSEESHGYLYVLGELWRGRRFLLLVTAIGALLTVAAALLLPKQYKATARIMPPDSQSSGSAALLSSLAGGAMPSAAASMGAGLLGGRMMGATFVGILQSDTIQNRLIDRFDLRKVYRRKLYITARKKLASRTEVAEDKKSGIITVIVTDNDPKRARDLAAAYVEELDVLVAQLSTSSARRERIFLEGRLKEIKKDLDDATASLSQFSSNNATLDMQDQAKAMLTSVATLQGQLIAAESQLHGLESIYAEDNSRVRALRAQIAELQSQLRKLSGTRGAADNPLSPDQTFPSLSQLPALGAKFTDLYRRAKVEETVFEVLTSQYEMAKVQEAKEIPTVKVLDEPEVPEKKSFPPRTLMVIGGALFSFCMGAVVQLWPMIWGGIGADHPIKQLLGLYRGLRAEQSRAS